MENKNVTIITGGSGGIGRNVVRKFLANDNKVIVLDVNEIKDEKILANENFEFIPTDVMDVKQIEQAKKIIEEKHMQVDNIISMAGTTMKSEVGGMRTITIEDIDKSIKLNLNAHIYITKIFMDLLKNNKNEDKTITMISSINAIRDYGLPAYSAAKAGLDGFMKAITKSMGELGTRVNIISLGTVPHNNENIEGIEYYESKIETLPLKKFVSPRDVADTIYSLIYTLKGINGQNIVLDMGQSI